MLEQILIDYRPTFVAILVALIGAFVAARAPRVASKSAAIEAFRDSINGAIAHLSSPDNTDMDAFDILRHIASDHCRLFNKAFSDSGIVRKYHLKKTWEDYYGEDGEQEWFLPNEYSTIESNQLKNTIENTKELAVHRLESLLDIV